MPHSPSLFLLCTFTVYIVSYLQRRRVARRRFVRKLHSGRKAIEARQPTYESGQLTQSRPPMNSDYDWLACHAHARSRPIFISLVYARWRTRGDGDTHDRGVCCTTSGYFSISWVSARRRKKKPARDANVCNRERANISNKPRRCFVWRANRSKRRNVNKLDTQSAPRLALNISHPFH